MKILIINAGSSSIKFKLFSTPKCQEIVAGLIDGIGQKQSILELESKKDGKKSTAFKIIKDHKEALRAMLTLLKESGGINKVTEIKIVGHRVVHGGEEFHKPTLLSTAIIKKLEKLSVLAPLHNPPNILGIKSAQKLIPAARQIAVFDTAFHQTLPEHAYKYALPPECYSRYKIRKYGFHGSSHSYVSQVAAQILGKKNSKLISCHLGNGCSITAIKNGQSLDTSMGFTPLEGVPMGTRSGDLDPAAILYLMGKKKLSPQAADYLLNYQSGLKALSQISSDMRHIWAAAKKGDRKARQTLDLFSYRIAKYIGAYATILGPLDGLIFTAGIGEHAWYIRENIIKRLKNLNIKLNKRFNKKCNNPQGPEIISQPDSPTTVLVIPTNEELEIARQCLRNL